MTYFELKKILAEHEAWLADSTKGAHANLELANLELANLAGAKLTGARLTGANLERANLKGAFFTPGWVLNKAPKVERIL